MKTRNYSIPTRTRMMRSSRHEVTQRRSFFTQCLNPGCCWGHKEEGSHKLPEAMPVCTGMQLLALCLPKCLAARRGGLQWGEAQYRAEAVLWV